MAPFWKSVSHSQSKVYYLFSLYFLCAHLELDIVESINIMREQNLGIDNDKYYSGDKKDLDSTAQVIVSPDKLIQNKSSLKTSHESLTASNANRNLTNWQGSREHLGNSPCLVQNNTVDCSGLSLDTIQPSWFPSNTETILFRDNSLRVLHNSTFSHLQDLARLDLSNNLINRIEPDAFEGLQNLRNLSLYGNQINFTYPGELEYTFYPILNLEELNVMQNQKLKLKVGVYTFTFLEKLSNLERLSTDFDQETLYLGPKFREMRNLTMLRISGSLLFINSSSFENVAQLKELHLERLTKIYNISRDVFKHLNYLKVLALYYVFLDVQYILLLLEPFQGRNMTEISFLTTTSSLSSPDPGKDGYLRGNHTQFLMNICLQKFSMVDCFIYYITPDAVQNMNTWDKCLTELTISKNPLNGNQWAIYRFLRLKNLREVTISDAYRPCYGLPQFPRDFNQKLPIDHTDNLLEGSRMDNLMEDVHKPLPYEGISNDLYVPPLIDTSRSVSLTTTYFTVSESINLLNIRRVVQSQTMSIHFIFVGAHNVQYLDLSDSGFYTFLGTIEGLTSLQTLIVSGNDISVLSISFFDTFPSLKNLGLSNCELDRDFVSLHSGRLFKNLPRLEQLDLSTNSLNYLSKDSFSYNPLLKYLQLSGNQFSKIPFSLEKTPELQMLDLIENSITNIDENTMRELDLLVSMSGQFQLLLSENVLSCGCNDLKFLQWMRSTPITFDQNGNFTCMNKEGERIYTLSFSDLNSLWRYCWGQVFFYVALILLCLYAIGVSVVFILLKNKHFVVSYFLKTFGGFRLHTRKDYPIDVYIGYSDTNHHFPCNVLRKYIENSLHLKAFLNDRDLMPSVYKASGIVKAINSSWRILLVCSESFLFEDEWSMFTIRSAIYSQSPANPARVVVLVHESCLPLLPPELLSSVNDENVFSVSDWTMNYKMTQMLKTRLA